MGSSWLMVLCLFEDADPASAVREPLHCGRGAASDGAWGWVTRLTPGGLGMDGVPPTEGPRGMERDATCVAEGPG